MSDDGAEPTSVDRPAWRRFELSSARVGPAPRWWYVGAAAAIAWLTWPVASFVPENGLDASWQIALSLAADRRLDFGHDIVFSYGPLGFLAHPRLVTTPTAVAGLLFAAAAQFSLCLLVLRRALRTFPWYVAVLLTYAAAAMLAASEFSNLGDYAVFIVFILVVQMLQAETPPAPWLIPLGGFLAAFQLLVKVNGGFAALALLVLAVWRIRPGGWRSELLLGASFVGFLVILWIAVGSALEDLPRWLYESLHVVGAYTSAMHLQMASGGLYFNAVVLSTVAIVLLLVQARGLDVWRTVTLLTACALYGFVYFKEGFVRLDYIHATLFFSAFAIGVLAIAWRAQTRWIAVAAVAASVGAVSTVSGGSDFVFGAGTRMGTLADDVDVLVHSGREISAGRKVVRDQLAVDAGSLALLRGHGVDVQPYETSAIWAYDLSWRPQPLLQSYVALDHQLDRFNARALKARGPERILNQYVRPALDRRHPLYLAPESYLVTLCRYRELRVRGDWQTLGRAGDRCGSSRLLRSVEAHQGESISVPTTPEPNELVYVRLHIRTTLTQRLIEFVFKSTGVPTIVLDGEPYRLVKDAARGPLILRMAKNAGVSKRFGGGLDYSTLTLRNIPSTYRADFFALPLGPGATR